MDKKRMRLIFNIIGGIIALGIVGFFFSGWKPQPPEAPNIEPILGQQPASNSSTTQPVQAVPSTNNPSSVKNSMHIITLTTSLGTIQFETFDADAPKTVQNFITLAQKGFYNNLIFHRIVKGFVIQGGDPKGDGTGGPGYTFADELDTNTESAKRGYKKGVVAMANAGPNTNGSQFFIMLEDNPLPHNYTIFGRVIKGQEVVDAIGKLETDKNDRPVKPVTIQSAKVETT